MATNAEELAAIQATIVGCTLCRLCEKRSNIVFGEGRANAKVMFIGEGPGADEDKTGRPFVGRAGQLLTKILQGVGWQREDVYITNIVKCRPPGNRDPKEDEMFLCERYLLAQIEAISPLVIATLGNVPKNYFLGDIGGITRVRGQLYKWKAGGIDIFPMYHPSYLLRNEGRHEGSPKWQTWQDIKALAQIVENKAGEDKGDT